MTEKHPFVRRLEDIETFIELTNEDIQAKTAVMAANSILRNPYPVSDESILYHKIPSPSDIDWDAMREIMPLQLANHLLTILRQVVLESPFNSAYLPLDSIHLQLRSLTDSKFSLRMKAEQSLISRSQAIFFNILQPSDELPLKPYSKQEAMEAHILRHIIVNDTPIRFYSLRTILENVNLQGNYKLSSQNPRLLLIVNPL
jgi:hypothetical protein